MTGYVHIAVPIAVVKNSTSIVWNDKNRAGGGGHYVLGG